MSARLPWLLFLVIGIFLGAMLCKVCPLSDKIALEPKFTFGDVITAFTALLIGGLLATYLQKQSETTRREKELLFHHLDLILEDLSVCERFKEGGPITDIAACLKRLSMKRQSIQRLLEEMHYPREILESVKFADKLAELRTLTTMTPTIHELERHAQSKKCTSVVRNGIIDLTQEKSALLDNKIQELKTQVIRAQLKINRR